MGKKIRSEMEKQRKRFVDGAVERGVEHHQAEYIFELLAKFADYGFNKSHAAAYALVAYQTAYLKANYPTEFLAASMTLDMGNADKVNLFRREAERMGISVLPPSVNSSVVDFSVQDGAIRYSLAALRNVGRAAVEHIVEARGERPFEDLTDFAARVSPRFLNKRALEGLAAAGAFDAFDDNRARITKGVDMIMSTAARSEDARVNGQSELFGGGKPEPLPLPAVEPWLPAERLTREYDAIGTFLSGHPLDEYEAVLEQRNVRSIAEFEELARSGRASGRIAGIVVSKTENRTRTGGRMGIITLSDPSGQVEAVAFSEFLAENRHLLEPGTCVEVLVQVDQMGDMQRLRLQKVRQLDDLAEASAGGIRIFLRGAASVESVAKRLGEPGEGEVAIVVMVDEPRSEVEIRLPRRYRVAPQITAAIRAAPGVVDVHEY
jgi:DNA polymerase-3 subunit alpha